MAMHRLLGTSKKSKKEKKIKRTVIVPGERDEVDEDDLLLNNLEPLEVEDVFRGVGVNWLMSAFRMPRKQVERRLRRLHPLREGEPNKPAVYDFSEACAYLVKPRIDVGEYLKSLKAQDLPNDLQKDYWEALIKKQKFQRQAGLLWRTEDVMDVMGDVFKTIKNTMQLWTDTLEKKQGITNDQRKMITKMVDALQSEIYHSLIDLKDLKRTPNTKVRHLEDGDDSDED